MRKLLNNVMDSLFWFWVDPALLMSLLSAMLFYLIDYMVVIMWYGAAGEGISVCSLWMWFFLWRMAALGNEIVCYIWMSIGSYKSQICLCGAITLRAHANFLESWLRSESCTFLDICVLT